MTYLQEELWSAIRNVKQRHLDYLRAQGVSKLTIAELGSRHFSFGVANVSDDGAGLYVPDEDGAPHLVLPVYEDGVLVDLCAFTTAAPAKWKLRAGQGWALGLFDGFHRHWWHGGAILSSTPIDWLRNGAHGLCVLDWASPEVSRLADLETVEVENLTVANVLTKALTKPPRLPKITFGEGIRHAA
jgi:hypothetical protein